MRYMLLLVIGFTIIVAPNLSNAAPPTQGQVLKSYHENGTFTYTYRGEQRTWNIPVTVEFYVSSPVKNEFYALEDGNFPTFKCAYRYKVDWPTLANWDKGWHTWREQTEYVSTREPVKKNIIYKASHTEELWKRGEKVTEY